jgi:hypothetical protein
MPVVAVIGGQWGDEGKGKVVDLLAQQAGVVVRFSGGDNAVMANLDCIFSRRVSSPPRLFVSLATVW